MLYFLHRKVIPASERRFWRLHSRHQKNPAQPQTNQWLMKYSKCDCRILRRGWLFVRGRGDIGNECMFNIHLNYNRKSVFSSSLGRFCSSLAVNSGVLWLTSDICLRNSGMVITQEAWILCPEPQIIYRIYWCLLLYLRRSMSIVFHRSDNDQAHSIRYSERKFLQSLKCRIQYFGNKSITCIFIFHIIVM